ncbi:hypothetical protein CFII64_01686 [Pseudomonas sp. CFII64]|jgi:hypothetical protein|nr:hypothetical protein [Pseudomonas sp. CFII64]EPJ89790.1 hypothetical protein CFII64_01686 [Pseudomonas sp. CFII64]
MSKHLSDAATQPKIEISESEEHLEDVELCVLIESRQHEQSLPVDIDDL